MANSIALNTLFSFVKIPDVPADLNNITNYALHVFQNWTKLAVITTAFCAVTSQSGESRYKLLSKFSGSVDAASSVFDAESAFNKIFKFDRSFFTYFFHPKKGLIGVVGDLSTVFNYAVEHIAEMKDDGTNPMLNTVNKYLKVFTYVRLVQEVVIITHFSYIYYTSSDGNLVNNVRKWKYLEGMNINKCKRMFVKVTIKVTRMAVVTITGTDAVRRVVEIVNLVFIVTCGYNDFVNDEKNKIGCHKGVQVTDGCDITDQSNSDKDTGDKKQKRLLPGSGLHSVKNI